MLSRELFDAPRLEAALQRLTLQVLERYPQLGELCVIGLQPRGVFLAERLRKLLLAAAPEQTFDYGLLDTTFYRDDLRRADFPILPNATEINFLVENRPVLLVDDVLYTGRTVRAALDALLTYGRPRQVELMVLIDRRGMRQLPVEANYTGIAVDTRPGEKVYVEWQEKHGQDRVRIALPEPQPQTR